MSSDVNQDFAELATQINAKLKEAAVALKEANRLKDEAKMPALIGTQWAAEEMDREERDIFNDQLDLINVRDLEIELSNAGWSTSSSYC